MFPYKNSILLYCKIFDKRDLIFSKGRSLFKEEEFSGFDGNPVFVVSEREGSDNGNPVVGAGDGTEVEGNVLIDQVGCFKGRRA